MRKTKYIPKKKKKFGACMLTNLRIATFPENLFESWSIENVQNFHWLSHKNMLISETEGYLKNS